jgi:hypothetical protein
MKGGAAGRVTRRAAHAARHRLAQLIRKTLGSVRKDIMTYEIVFFSTLSDLTVPCFAVVGEQEIKHCKILGFPLASRY